MREIARLKDFVENIEELMDMWGKNTSTTYPWFRGQADESWKLLPRLYREGEVADREREMVRDFALRANAFLPTEPQSYMERLFVMQHHGMPTRLLDWSESYLIALFFSVEDTRNTNNGAVWVMGPANFNKKLGLHEHTVPMSDASVFSEYEIDISARRGDSSVEAEEPIAVRPRRSTPRIVAQRGMFTIHGNQPKSLEKYCDMYKSQKILHKIIIAGSAKEKLKRELLLSGVSYSSLFPDLDGLAEEISYRYS
ncbi:MAG: FRG domain-containing protein [Rhodothermaceae bacterium]|nr:FRG domain-containing protein [Rhodothermaceae bacterium]